MNTFSHVPPGFRFHPTDEELVDYYLRKKVTSRKIDFDVIRELDLYKIEPWDLQERCRIGVEEQNEWYFFSHKDKKYPTGTRTNRATTAGFWKATGRDKPIYSRHVLVGMRKTLVYYKGRAPNGQKSDWIMHEYRLETNENGTAQEEGWVVCRVFRKRVTALRRDHESPCWYDEQLPFFPDLESPNRPISHADMITYQQHPYSCKQEIELHYSFPNHHFLQLPQLESPKLPNHISQGSAHISSPLTLEDSIQPLYQHRPIPLYNSNSKVEESVDQVTDWRVLDKFVASQLSQDDAPKEPGFPNAANDFQVPYKPGTLADLASTSASSCPIDLWK